MREATVPVSTFAGEAAEVEHTSLLGWVASVDHKQIGLMYLIGGFVFFCIAGLMGVLMRIQLARPHNDFLSPETFNQLFTIHGTTMLFLAAMPMLIGLGTYLVPLMIGARDMAFPRLNALSFWVQLFGGFVIFFSFVGGGDIGGGAADVGWFSYAPLSERAFSIGPGVDYWVVGLIAAGIGSIGSAINFVVTVVKLRAPGMTFRRLPLFVWMTFINSFIILFAIPLLSACLAMLLADRLLGAHFFTAAGGGSPLLWQHIFWAFGHPEVYLLVLPAFGIISEVIPVFSGKPIYGYEFVAGSTIAIAFLSFGVYAHHMFAVGLGHAFDLLFAAGSLLIAVPTGIKVLNWTATLHGGRIRFLTPMLFALGFIAMFTIGGLSGITFAVVPIDWQMTDSYYVVAHFHYVLFGGTIFAIFAGIYYWFPKFTGRMLSERLGRWHFWLTLIGFNLTFFVQHLLGMMGMPRRVFTYPDLPHWGTLNFISTVGALVMMLSVAVLIWNLVASLSTGELASSNPWDGWTLEWATSSPPPVENFDRVPPIRGRRPLWDLAHPDQTDEAAEVAL